jgi:hypothetical protein
MERKDKVMDNSILMEKYARLLACAKSRTPVYVCGEKCTIIGAAEVYSYDCHYPEITLITKNGYTSTFKGEEIFLISEERDILEKVKVLGGKYRISKNSCDYHEFKEKLINFLLSDVRELIKITEKDNHDGDIDITLELKVLDD